MRPDECEHSARNCLSAKSAECGHGGDILGDIVGGRHQRRKMADFATALRTIRLRFMPNPPFVDVDAVVRQMFTDQAWTSHALRITGARLCHQPRITPEDTSSTESDARSARSRSIDAWCRTTAATSRRRARDSSSKSDCSGAVQFGRMQRAGGTRPRR